MTLSDSDLVRLLGLAEGASKVAGAEWDRDTQCDDGYDYAYVSAGVPMLGRYPRLVDTLNADSAFTEEDRAAICDHIAAASPATIRSMVEELQAARKALDQADDLLVRYHGGRNAGAPRAPVIDELWPIIRQAAPHHEEG